MSNKIIAITIGPIYETMQMVTKPAGLWAASYLFSYISRSLTEVIKIKYPGNIITPYFSFDENARNLQKQGVGFYHDHVLVRDANLGEISKIIKNVVNDIGIKIYNNLKVYHKDFNAQMIDKQSVTSYISSFLQIHAIETEEPDSSNAILATSRQLDAVELLGSFIPYEETNYLSLFLNDNFVIKKSFLVNELQCNDKRWMLLKNEHEDTIKDISTIAESDSDSDTDWKRYDYYALVNSDGDRMGKIIGSLQNDEEIREFSQKCLRYTTKACERILEFGGVVIYAGGDDLQFLAPLTHKNGNKQETIFNLIDKITSDFKDVFKEEITRLKEKPAVSFGVMIAYHLYPLYEVLAKSYGLLYSAKNSGRDAAVIRMEKHSGQTAEITICHLRDHLNELVEFFAPVISMQMEDNQTAQSAKVNAQEENTEQSIILKSIIDHLYEKKSLWELALKDCRKNRESRLLENCFNNTFDNIDQKKFGKYLKCVKELMNMFLFYPMQDEGNSDGVEVANYHVDDIISILRILQFFGEKGKEERRG